MPEKTALVYLPSAAAAMMNMAERDGAARHTFQRRPLPPVELQLLGVFSANGRYRTRYSVTVDGEEVGTAIERADLDTLPWRLTMPGSCGNLGHATRDSLLKTVRRVLTTGQIWES